MDTVSIPEDPVLRGILKTAFAASIGIFNLYRSGIFSVERKSDQSHLTSADLLSNKICHRGLMETLPCAGWLSEESTDSSERLLLDDVWIVDPIDGTREFVKGVDEFSVSIGLSRKGRADYGAIAIPPAERIIFGGAGHGVYDLRCDFKKATEMLGDFEISENMDVNSYFNAFTGEWATILNSCVIKKGVMSSASELPHAGILISRTEWERGKYADYREDLKLLPSGSVARKLGLVSIGEGDLSVSLNRKNDWDICGGIALVLAAGGEAIELENYSRRIYNVESPLSFGLVAGNKTLVKKFAEYLRIKKFNA